MEDWSKEICNLEQQREDFCPKFQLCPSSSRSLQPQHELVIQGNAEAMNLSDLPTATSLNIQSASTQNVCLDSVIAPCTAEESSITEKHGRMLSDFMASWNTGDLDKETNITFLLKELDAVRAKNKKLQDKLSEKDKELKTIKLDLELQERATEAKIAEKTAALVEEVYTAQRERDEAVMARLRLANEERDEALLRAKHLEQSLKGLENINPEENDMILQELLNRINNADTGIAIQKNGAIIVDRIHRTKERRKNITAEEMNAVIEERDAALSQCKRLEQELHHLKEQNQTSANNTRHLTAENNQERALKAKLLVIQQERETAVQQNKKLEEEIQTLRVYYSLHKSLSQEVSLKDQFNCTLSTYEDALKSSEDIVTITHRQNEQLATQLQQALTERINMELKLQQALEASQEANEKVQTLERLVDVLRKKVGAGTIRTVI
ncbi:mirror-image polydactyly gene 1 protein isoform X1 [Gopherus evgoodei]|uniref:Mirror-image polydactyly 1 n=3 Tax=Gopherus evgoodei TaxID=1825980 RepID=A0A8C4VMF8_9SAUR|nr:mirror-image polydactyly gene 1 protein isoform X1 [Gopherus evgoodei]XP_030415099.1 mirror-image polydactyly gene 1 protein isoform X1 [Gopherus evgoodei]XP_030415100.1 mirror-image polydactyly gene 1 protein isoform X1 [Gopherus evgoodei]